MQKMLENMSGIRKCNQQVQDAMDKARENAEKEIEQKEENAADNAGGLSAGKDLGFLELW